MGWWERTLHIDMAKQRIVAFGSAKIGKPFEAPERRPRIVSPFRSAAFVRVMIPPQRRDRWFKSSPATILFKRRWLIALRDRRPLRSWRVRVIRFSLIGQRIQVTESESIDAGNAPALHLCTCREKLAREIAVYRMQ